MDFSGRNPFSPPDSSSSARRKRPFFAPEDATKTVSIIGTGQMGSALATRFAGSRIDVYLGSRRGRDVVPFYPVLQYVNVHAGRIADCIVRSDIVILAIPPETILGFLNDYKNLLDGRIVVDASNPGVDSASPDDVSMGEFVQQTLSESFVVKAFTLNSAFQMSRDRVSARNAPRVVAFCGSNARAKRRFSELLVHAGLDPLDLGGIEEARHMETAPLNFFAQWKIPACVALSIFANAAAYVAIRDYVLGDDEIAFAPIQIAAVSSAWTASWLLAGTYLPGLLATRIVVRPLPTWFVSWLDMRKQTGILCYVASCAHVACLLFALQSSAERYGDIRDATYDLTAWAQGGCLAGVASLFALTWVLFASFLGTGLTWKEWTFVQRRVGWFAVWCALAHAVLFVPTRKPWRVARWPRGLPPASVFTVTPLIACGAVKILDAASRSFASFLRFVPTIAPSMGAYRHPSVVPASPPPAFFEPGKMSLDLKRSFRSIKRETVDPTASD